MTKPALVRDSVCVSEARRLPQGIEVQARFFALKVSNPEEGPRYYTVTLTINPHTKGVRGHGWQLTKSNSADMCAYEGPKDKLRSLEEQVRDVVLTTAAWEILMGREPDPSYVVDELGKVIELEPKPPLIRRL